MMFLKIFSFLFFVNIGFFFLILFMCLLRFVFFWYLLSKTTADVLLFTYDDDDASDDISDRFLEAYDIYFGFLFEWEREYWAYYVEDQDDEGDGKELDDFELTEAAYIMYMWYFKLLFHLGYLNEMSHKGLNSVKDLQKFILVKKHKKVKGKKR